GAGGGPRPSVGPGAASVRALTDTFMDPPGECARWHGDRPTARCDAGYGVKGGPRPPRTGTAIPSGRGDARMESHPDAPRGSGGVAASAVAALPARRQRARTARAPQRATR